MRWSGAIVKGRRTPCARRHGRLRTLRRAIVRTPAVHLLDDARYDDLAEECAAAAARPKAYLRSAKADAEAEPFRSRFTFTRGEHTPSPCHPTEFEGPGGAVCAKAAPTCRSSTSLGMTRLRIQAARLTERPSPLASSALAFSSAFFSVFRYSGHPSAHHRLGEASEARLL